MDAISQLHLIWTSGNPIVAEKMVLMYAVNSLLNGWWQKVTVVIWGASATLVTEDTGIQQKIREALDDGVQISACQACADQLGVTNELEALGIDIRYWGEPLTDLLKHNAPLITI